MIQKFHSLPSPARGVRLLVVKEGTFKGMVIKTSLNPLLRAIAGLLSIVFFFSSSPVLFASMAREMMAGGGGSGGKGTAANLQNAGAASASLTATLAHRELQRTDAAVNAMKALQVRAHAIMAPVGTPNGLKAGWLETRDGFKSDGTPITTSWSGAQITSANGANNINIKQSTQNAYLYWKNFSVGPQTKVNFDQSAGGNSVGTWIAFNKVMGSVNPTQIFGSITAQGQVYVLNQNGIIFHNGSQVNTHALVASTLPINENLAGSSASRGIANNPDYQFLFSALPVAAGKNGPTPVFTPTISGALGDVTVEEGASINAPANSSHTGGLVALIGPNVHNAGSISTPNGQTILAAGLQVGLVPHSSSDPSLRGMDVYVGKISDPSITTVSSSTGLAENSGIFSTSEGDATLAGAVVHQYGVIDSSTSVSLNGRIDLLASYNTGVNSAYNSQQSAFGGPLIYQSTGVVDMGSGSMMRILPELGSTETIAGTALAINSVVSIIGQEVNLQSGSVIQAPGAVATHYSDGSYAKAQTAAGDFVTSDLKNGITINAGSWFDDGKHNIQFYNGSGKITLNTGSVIDLSGSTGVQVNSKKMFLSLQLRGNELADSSLQRNGPIRGVSLTLDSRITGAYNGQYWIGTPLGDATGFVNLIERSVGELTTAGGTVSMSAGDSVAMQVGSVINVSGGWVNYSGGKFSTSKLIYQGHLVDISQATPNITYSQIYSSGATVEKSTKWGVNETFESILDPTRSQYQPSYISGAAGGSISISAPSQILNGSLEGITVAGPRQVRTSSTLSTLPSSSALSINIYGQQILNNQPALISPHKPDITFGEDSPTIRSSILLSTELVSSDGFGSLTVLNHDGRIFIPKNTTLDLGVSGHLSLEAANINVEGNILTSAGTVSLTSDLASYEVLNTITAVLVDSTGNSIAATKPYQNVLINKLTGNEVVQYGEFGGGSTPGTTTVLVPFNGSLSQSTLVDVPNSDLLQSQTGKITIGSSSKIETAGVLGNDLLSSSRRYIPIALSGGKVQITGYNVNLEAGSLINVSGGVLVPTAGSTVYGNAGSISILAGQDNGLKDAHEGTLKLGSTLQGYAGLAATGGTLYITAPTIVLGNTSSTARRLAISPDFFNQGGFQSFNLSGVGDKTQGSSSYIPGIEIASKTIINPVVSSVVAMNRDGGVSLQSISPNDPLGKTPSITLTALGLSDQSLPVGSQLLVRGDLLMGVGSSISLEPRLNVNVGTYTPTPLTPKITLYTPTPSTGSIVMIAKQGTVSINGSIVVPGGNITITAAGTFPSNDSKPSSPLATLDIAPSALLSTTGVPLFTTDPSGVQKAYGSVLSGGTIALIGNIVAEAGAVLQASGATGVYDLLPSQVGLSSGKTSSRQTPRTITLPTQVDTAGGTISLQGGEMLYSDAMLIAKSGGITAAGGSLILSSGRSYDLPSSSVKQPTDLNLAVSQNGIAIPATFNRTGASVLGHSITPSDGIPEGGGHVAIKSFVVGGFNDVTLAGNVIFNGPIDLSLPGKILVATKGNITADSQVNLSATYVALGTPFIAPLQKTLVAQPAFGTTSDPDYIPPVYGSGVINVTASLIDIGNLSLQNIGSVVLSAKNGAIRGDGTLDVAGDLTLQAAQIYPSSGVNFTIDSYDHNGKAGSIVIQQSGRALPLPLSAGGQLSFYASSIIQSGTLVAPFGVINLGSIGSGPIDPVSGVAVQNAQHLTLDSSSMTSVSGVDPLNGNSISVPYGSSTDGTSWIDLSGKTITSLNAKSINLAANSVVSEKKSLLNLQGGGNETASEWISGLGGHVNLLGSAGSWSSVSGYAAGDLVTYQGSTWSARQANSGVTPAVGLNWSKVPQSYAIIPGYQPLYAPTGYSDGTIGIGSQIRINGGAGLPAGTYTLLPASYGTQQGAYLISAASASGSLAGSITQPDGSVLVSGTHFKGLDSGVSIPMTTDLFQLLSPKQIASRAEYKTLDAGTFFTSSSSSSAPQDAAKLVFNANASISVKGSVSGQAATGGRAASIDISAPSEFDITRGGFGGGAGHLMLSSDVLNTWSYGSLLIGGLRGALANGLTPITVNAKSITLADGATLTGSDIILVANQSISLVQGASISAQGNTTAPDESLLLGKNVGEGNGVLLRVSSDANIAVTRKNVASQSAQQSLTDGNGNSITPKLILGNNASLSGSSLILDSSALASLDSSSQLNAKVVTLNAGGIAVLVDAHLNSGSLDISDAKSLQLFGLTLDSLQNSSALALGSYSTLDWYGAGQFGSSALSSLRLHAGEMRGFDLNGQALSLAAQSIRLDNIAQVSASGAATGVGASDGYLELNAGTIALGANAVAIDQFSHLSLNATGEVLGTAVGGLNVGSVLLPTDVSVTTPLITGTGSSVTTWNVSGNLALKAPDHEYATTAEVDPGLGAKIIMHGSGVSIDTAIRLPSGSLAVTATSGDLIVGGQGKASVDVGGARKDFFNVSQYTDAGNITLTTQIGNVVLAQASTLNLSAQPQAGTAGELSVSAPIGQFSIDPAAVITARGGSGGKNGSFSLDVGSLDPTGAGASLLSMVAPALNDAGFTQSLSFRVRKGDANVDTYINAHHFSLSVDHGSIDVTPHGVINASGNTGGSLSLVASGSVILEPNSFLTVQGDTYDAAGKGGSILLSAGAEINGVINPNAVLDIQTASAIDLGVTAPATGIQDLGGVLHLRAPINSSGTDVQIAHLDGTISGASSVEVEGYRPYDLTPAGGGAAEISTQIGKITSDAQSFFGAPGANSTVASAILDRLTQNMDSSTAALVNLASGVEIINQSGDLTLNSDWDFSGFRVGANSAPGFLTVRAADDITLNASLSDGFQSSAYNANLLSQSQNLPVNFQSWEFNLTAGSDLTSASANIAFVNPNSASGNLNLGIISPAPITASGGASAVTATAISGNLNGTPYNYYQVIRTGTGDITINTSGNIQLRNLFASIYTAGVQVTDSTLGGTFDTPMPNFIGQITGTGNKSLGAVQQITPYSAQFSYAGGSIILNSGGDIKHVTVDSGNNLIDDSVRELPSNWLYRRGAVNPATGEFMQMSYGNSLADIASTAWWVDYSNFFEGVGALGGGNVTLNAVHDIANVDAVIPTNFRMAGHAKGSTLAIAPDTANGVELGGGDISLHAGNNIDAGVYYVEKGKGYLTAGGSIITNPTRDAVLPKSINPTSVPGDATTYLPTTLFLGKGNFSVNASGDIYLGPIANAFLMPQSVNNGYWYKDYFSTYAQGDSVSVQSLGGSVSLRQAAYASTDSSTLPLLQIWETSFTTPNDITHMSYYQPWLRLAEYDISDLGALFSLKAPSLNVTDFSGDINIQGDYIAAPSPEGNISLLANDNINGLTQTGVNNGSQVWYGANINLSDANPGALPGITSPTSQRSNIALKDQSSANANGQKLQFMTGVSALFSESGSYAGSHGSLQAKQTLHSTDLLHSKDSTPLELYALEGDISGLSIYSPKRTIVTSGGDITDVGFYIQNVSAQDISMVSAGGDIVVYDPNSKLQLAQSENLIAPPLQSGDIQISGPGTLEVLAGGNVDLGNNPGSSDPTLNVGITSIGNARNPALPFAGADVIVGAGVKLPYGLSSANGLMLNDFATTVLVGSEGSTYLSELPDTLTYSGDTLNQTLTAASFDPASTQLSDEEKARLELQLFYIVLRDTGRNHNKVDSPGFGNYTTGEQAIKTFFGNNADRGNVTMWSQNIRTKNGGNISIFAPSGGLSLASTASGSSLTPPGIVTEHGGAVNIYTEENVDIGIGRIFTLRGGDITIWSNLGNIAAGSSAKTVATAPPTRVLIDPQSGDVETDLAGLATGGGIGVLETVADVPPGNVDLIAPTGVIDAGDAGIRSSGNLNLAATRILNADNIAASGTVAGAPPAAPPPAAPNISGATAAAAAGAASTSAANNTPNNSSSADAELPPSVFSVEVLGYGGSDDAEDDSTKKPTTSSGSTPPPQASL